MNFRPIFVIGVARSGTNLLARMLDRHAKVAIALDPLMPVFRALRNAVTLKTAPKAVRQRFDPASPFQDFYFNPDGPALADAVLGGSAELVLGAAALPALRAAVQERAALESADLAERLGALEGRTYRDLLQNTLEIIHETRPGALWVGCKEVWIFDFIPLLARAFPEARFYAIERDPRGVVASLLAMAKRDASQAAHVPSYLRHWRKSVALSMLFESDPALQARFRRLNYEALVADPQREATRICGELSVAFDARMLELSADGWKGNSSYEPAADVYASSSDRWRAVLPRDVVATADFLSAPEMVLTPYRASHVSSPQRTVLPYLREADASAFSWTSSSGDAEADFRGELMRYTLLEGTDASTSAMRLSFLFPQTLAAIQAARLKI